MPLPFKELICRTHQHYHRQWLSGHIPWDEPEQAIGGYERKFSEKRKVLRREWKCQQPVQDQSMTMEKSWVMMMYQTDKEHEQSQEARDIW